jgi:hypothetical protein
LGHPGLKSKECRSATAMFYKSKAREATVVGVKKQKQKQKQSNKKKKKN